MQRPIHFLESIIIGLIVFLTLLIVWHAKCSGEPITEHFKREEFNQTQRPLPLSQVKVDYALVQMLEVLRITIGNKPIIIVSGFRTPAYQALLKKQGRNPSPTSYHLLGKAADIQVKGMTPQQLAYAAQLYFSYVYVCGKSVHVDVR